MSDVVPFPEKDHLAEAYKTVRDATLGNENITVAEQVGVLELIKAEILRNAQATIDEE